MKDLRGIKGKYYIASLIEQGEHVHQDFKFAVSDAHKIARSISAFANNDGGRLLIGVKDNGVIAGVRNEEDIYVVEQAAEMYCTPSQSPVFTAFRTDGGLTVIRVEIARAAQRPVHVRETDGKLKAYYRVADENILAPELMVESWRRSASAQSGAYTITPHGTRLLELASRPGGVTVDDFMIDVHLSRAAAEEIALSLCGMGLVEFTYDGSRFTLTEIAPE
ncbi:MAG: ATP-binding protein [Duncaniella sp.]|nr:ATP-binding protein [Duncaniella sp.]